jgi:hypothetical protein
MIELASGRLAKMSIEKTEPLSYHLNIGDEKIGMNAYIGKDIRIISNGEIRCAHCQRRTNKSFNQGYCFPCFKKLAQCDRCMMSPELCHFSKGTCREPDWAEQFCMQEHIVYLANSSGLKVGITRHTQVPTRWMDQGAIQALPIISVSTRQLSGLVEVIMKEWVADKTNWRKMLKHDVEEMDLAQERDKLFELAKDVLADLRLQFPDDKINLIEAADTWQFEYPSSQWPEKIKTFNLEKQNIVEGKLLAIKGQYLILDSGCFNVRKHTSFDVSLSAV